MTGGQKEYSPEKQLRDEVAQEKYGKNFDDLAPEERMSVGGTVGGRKGGATRRDQLGHEGYSEMGKTGAKKGGYSTGYEHNPEEAAQYTEQVNAGFAPEDTVKGGRTNG